MVSTLLSTGYLWTVTYFSKLPDSRDNCGLKHGVPSADTLLRVFTIIEPESIREVDGKRSIEMRYYILDQNISAEEMSHIVRGHWEIERIEL